PAARSAAKAREVNGEAGYLANVTSEEENAFLLGLLQEAAKDAWLGGSDTAGTGYRWFDGPEAGTLFWNGVGNGGSAVSGQYSNWGAGEPNDFGWSTGLFSTTYESYAMMTHSTSFVIGGWTRSTSPGKWNDAPLKTSSSSSYRLGYLVEYGASATDGLLFAKTRTIEMVKGVPVITAVPTASAITFGQVIGDSILSGGLASVPGVFTFTNPSWMPTATGTTVQGVVFTPTDAMNYRSLTTSAVVTVNPAPATMTLSDLIQTYDTTAKGVSVFTSPSNLPVTVTYNGSTNPPVNAGSYTVVASVTDVNYTGTTTNTLVIAKATPIFSALPTASAITAGQALSASSLSGGQAKVGTNIISGNFDWTTPTTLPSATGNYPVTFTPTDTANYNTVTTTVSVTVNKATPTISAAPIASAITAGQALSASTLSGGTASVPGTFSWTTPSTVPSASGSYSVTFTPT
ncbi:hypothetical protein EBT23_07095, partial [bacterium]|nr:hypothetical protein [bacterium]